MQDRPLIAVVGELAETKEVTLTVALRYCEAIDRAGGLPLAVPQIASPGFVAQLLERVDGLLVTGGDDFDTARLGLGPTHPEARVVPARKQDFDLAVVRAALARGLPCLGICYGMQLCALAEGGSLYQHLPEDRPGGAEHRGGVEHTVRLEAGSRIASILGVPSHDVVSRHHQAVASTRPPWIVTARDGDGLIEAIEREGTAFALGVQWHPELGARGGRDERILAALVAAAGERALASVASPHRD